MAQLLAAQLREHPELRLIAVLPRNPDPEGVLSGPPNWIGQVTALAMLRPAAGDRIGISDIENESRGPIHIHAKVNASLTTRGRWWDATTSTYAIGLTTPSFP
ncbi:MAG: phospholipase D-like domain-containing protein, partial [Candidatus Dormibacteria bacterium]